MAKSGNGDTGNTGNTGNSENGGLNPGFSVSFDSESGTYTPSGPTTPSWAPGNTPGSGDTNPAGLNNSENNKDSKNNINLNEEAAKAEAAKKNAEKSNDKNKAPNIPDYVITEQSEAIERGKNFLNPSFEYAVTHYDNNAPATTNNAPADTSAPTTTPAANNAPGGNLGGEAGGIVSGAAPTNTSDATNTGVTYRGGTVTTPSGTSVTDSGTGGSISSSIATPIRDASSIGLGVYNNDRANYDQDNWNRGMESESSSLVSDEECKAFAKRAFMENSEPFKKVRITIIKNVR